MSNPTPAEITNAALLAARLSGCNCDPDIILDTDGLGINHARIAHDTWCHLLNRLNRKARRWN